MWDVELQSGTLHREVVVLRWPEQATERDRLNALGVPHLLLVEPGTAPPVSDECLEDWLRLPADDADARARIHMLSLRAGHHPVVPTLDDHGQLAFRGACEFLSPIEHRLAQPMVESFGGAVPDESLMRSAWPAGGSEPGLRVHASRLRRRVLPLGLAVVRVPRFGYLMRDTAPISSS
jgi:hypothetical protein